MGQIPFYLDMVMVIFNNILSYAQDSCIPWILVSLGFISIVTSCVIGRGNIIGPMCMCLSVSLSVHALMAKPLKVDYS